VADQKKAALTNITKEIDIYAFLSLPQKERLQHILLSHNALCNRRRFSRRESNYAKPLDYF
jgi:hypothetical protein